MREGAAKGRPAPVYLYKCVYIHICIYMYIYICIHICVLNVCYIHFDSANSVFDDLYDMLNHVSCCADLLDSYFDRFHVMLDMDSNYVLVFCRIIQSKRTGLAWCLISAFVSTSACFSGDKSLRNSNYEFQMNLHLDQGRGKKALLGQV